MSIRARAGRGWFVLAMCGVAAVACGSEPTGLDGVVFSVDAEAYAVGDTVWATLANNRSGDIGFNFCAADLQRWAGRAWVSVPRRPDNGACIALLPMLAPGESSTGMQVMYPFLDPGNYRFVGDVWIEGAPHPVISDLFGLAE